MARQLRHLVSPPEPCHYLAGRSMTTESRVMLDVSPDELQRLLELGWRRFGPIYFRPVCTPCGECVSVRVPVNKFVPSHNMQRVLKRAEHLRLVVSAPVVDDTRLELHRRWHASREQARDWESSDLDRDSYSLQFGFPHPSAREFSFYEGDRLVAVGIADETPSALSLVYCFHEPSRSELSLGTFNVLKGLEHARRQGLQYVYLGYRVEGCASLKYKGRFRPQERLAGRPELGDAPAWRLYEGE
ncbi:MAG: arginyltransferase [Deltaproteobacteria bacterium]|nr:arginyltransferase [Deltaproteobacteria bacterium]